MIRVEMRASRSCGRWVQSAVMKSSVVTQRTAIASSYVRASPITPTICTGSSTANACDVAAIQAGRFDFADHDRVGFAQRVEPLARDFAQAAHGQAGAGERVPPDDFFGQAELQAELADFVFEQVAQRLDQLEAELGRQAADVVVQLDRVGRAVGRGAAFDHVGVERALGQKLGVLDFAGLGGEALDERVADAAAFFLRLGDAGQRGQKPVLGLHDVQIGLEVLRELLDDRLAPRLCASRPLSTRMHESCGPIA